MSLMSWYKKIVTFGIIICSLTILTACSSQASLQYNDKSSNVSMIKSIEQQYKQWNNTPYRYGGNSLNGIDCSAFVNNFYNEKLDMSIPRITAEQAKLGKKVSNLQAGDLVFFKTGRGANGLHVGIYYKDGKFLHVSTSSGVRFSNINETYWKKRYWQAKRVVL